MNTTLNDSFETNFRGKCNTALSQSHSSLASVGECNAEGKCNYEELIRLLSSDNIKEKHFAVLELEEIHSQEHMKALVSNLVGQDGKIREAVAFKINEFSQNPDYAEFFIDDEIFDILLQGVMDINGNVCRQIVNGKWFKNQEFITYLCKNLPERINEILNEIEKIDQKSKQYVISKRNFQLYWSLEALYNIIENVNFESIKNILSITGEFYDYTIREKTAKIVSKIEGLGRRDSNPALLAEFKDLKEKLKNDENYYVRRYLCDT